MLIKKSVTFLSLLVFAGCSVQVPRDGDFISVENFVHDRIAQDIHWYRGGEEDEAVKKALNKLLEAPLTADSAVQVALLNNHRLQAEYAKLGVAQADLVQAGLLSNPVLFSSIRFPKGGNGGNNLEFDIAVNFLDILLRSSRQNIAAADFERVKINVSGSVLDLAAEVLIAYYRALGMEQLAKIQDATAEASGLSYQMARRFDEAGNLSELELAQHRSASATMHAERLLANSTLQIQRDQLNRLMGLSGTEAARWQFATALPQLPTPEPESGLPDNTALASHPELMAAEQEGAQLSQALELTRSYRWIGGMNFGVNTERETDGTRLTGPNFSVEIPIFDQRQAEIARLESLLEQSRSRTEALRAEIHNRVETAMNKVKAARELTEYYRDELLPAREQVVEFTQQEQNYMLTDVFELLYARQQQSMAWRGYIEALTGYWIARVELDHAAGGRLTLTSDTAYTNQSGDDANRHQDQTNIQPHDGMTH